MRASNLYLSTDVNLPLTMMYVLLLAVLRLRILH